MITEELLTALASYGKGIQITMLPSGRITIDTGYPPATHAVGRTLTEAALNLAKQLLASDLSGTLRRTLEDFNLEFTDL